MLDMHFVASSSCWELTPVPFAQYVLSYFLLNLGFGQMTPHPGVDNMWLQCKQYKGIHLAST